MTRKPDWDVDRARGEEAEALWRETRTGIVVGTAEVKRDDGAFTYGNFYFEYECYRGGEWRPSGIAETKATNWVQIAFPICIAMPVWMLKNVLRQHGEKRELTRGSHPTRGLVISVDQFVPYLLAAAHEPATNRAAA